MKAKVLKVEVSGVKIFNDSKFSIDLFSNYNVSENDKLFLHHLSKHFYYAPVITLAGINATGKTTALNLLATVMELHLNWRPLSRTSFYKRFLSSDIFENELVFSSTLYLNKRLVKICSYLKKEDNILNEQYIIVEEEIYEKEITTKVKKQNIFDFNKWDLKWKRSDLEKDDVLLSNDLSIIRYFLKRKKLRNGPILPGVVLNLTSLDHESNKSIYKDFNVEFAKYLDSSIEILSKVNNGDYSVNEGQSQVEDRTLYNLKFKNFDRIYQINEKELPNYLSIGTVRGLNLFQFIMMALKHGGIVLVDELENNLNKAIITDIIKLFYSKKTNPNGAVLIFTTHYSELLDSVRRTDSIFVFEKDKTNYTNRVYNMADVVERHDLKKSETFISNNLLISTVPSSIKMREIQLAIINELLINKAIMDNEKL